MLWALDFGMQCKSCGRGLAWRRLAAVDTLHTHTLGDPLSTIPNIPMKHQESKEQSPPQPLTTKALNAESAAGRQLRPDEKREKLHDLHVLVVEVLKLPIVGDLASGGG